MHLHDLYLPHFHPPFRKIGETSWFAYQVTEAMKELQGPVVRKVNSAIQWIVIFSTVVKMLEKLKNRRYRTYNL